MDPQILDLIMIRDLWVKELQSSGVHSVLFGLSIPPLDRTSHRGNLLSGTETGLRDLFQRQIEIPPYIILVRIFAALIEHSPVLQFEFAVVAEKIRRTNSTVRPGYRLR